ncbi:2Fe-2S iron-sulfur cluster binding domain-containing protein [Psychromonas sp. Urea-02u-13]|uniref:2Fe-2S iron-sulfur cluster binding domain-containing protein n=1 Tax=Psychromonas sp. Urea-02u-13 TaxID=2058326 RepID=UPI000C32A2FC|nr:2Fe-2S iron-sulfur cluster binding domain-containing protein [Psychromonas sp. Urea-02u-13]PKG37196.1 hypothetical protein CXF74_20145 [Psychromonas sp. Urea-02u-13]
MKVSVGDKLFTSNIDSYLLDILKETHIPRGCMKGLCRVCKCRLIKGTVEVEGKQIEGPADILPCITSPISDVSIKLYDEKLASSSIELIEELDDKILQVTLKTVKRNFYNSKTIVNIKHPEKNLTRPYSLVSLPNVGYDQLVFHVKLQDKGEFSTLFEKLSQGFPINFKLENQQLPIYRGANGFKKVIVVAGGTGMGAALSRGVELIRNYKLQELYVYAINRGTLSQYHQYCLDQFQQLLPTKTTVDNIPYQEWITGARPIVYDKNSIIVAIGSNNVISVLDQQTINCITEIERFG